MFHNMVKKITDYMIKKNIIEEEDMNYDKESDFNRI